MKVSHSRIKLLIKENVLGVKSKKSDKNDPTYPVFTAFFTNYNSLQAFFMCQ
jgi:hypothetical protein